MEGHDGEWQSNASAGDRHGAGNMAEEAKERGSVMAREREGEKVKCHLSS